MPTKPNVCPDLDLCLTTEEGELLDGQWPHQVALPAGASMGHHYFTIRIFCENLSLGPLSHSFRRNGRDFNVFCFRDAEHAERFRERFGGRVLVNRRRDGGN